MTDEHLEFHADRYVRHGIKDCSVTLIQYLADPARYAPLESLLPRQRIAAGKAMAEMSMPIERVAIEPPVWCHQCGAMLARRVTLSGSTATAVKFDDALAQIEELEDRLRAIGDFAHEHSTGPAAPDAMWEVRSMAYGT